MKEKSGDIVPVSYTHLACRLSLRAEESWGEPEPAELCAAAEEREAARISAALEQLKGWNADCLGLARCV